MSFSPYPLPTFLTLAACALVCAVPKSGAAEEVTLTDASGRSITGRIEAFSGQSVTFKINGRPTVKIPLEKLSEGSRNLLFQLEDQGEIGSEAWPEKAPLSKPYKFKAEGDVWTGDHVRIEFVEAPESRSSSAPEVAFLKMLDRVIAVSKAIPLGGLVERDRTFVCRIESPGRYGSLEKDVLERNKSRFVSGLVPPPEAVPVRDERSIILGPRVRQRVLPPPLRIDAKYEVNWCYDEQARTLHFRSDVPEDFLAPVPGIGVAFIPLEQRHRMIRTAAVHLAFGEKIKLLPPEFVEGLVTYFETIEQVAGEDLKFAKVGAGLRDLIKTGLPRYQKGQPALVRPSPGEAGRALAAGSFPPNEIDAMLVAYYLLHLDGNGNAPALAAWSRAVRKEYRLMQAAVEKADAAKATFQPQVVEYNRACEIFRSKAEAYEAASRSGPGPDHPGPPPVSPSVPEEISAPLRILGAAELKGNTALMRGRSPQQFATDFRAALP